MRAFLHEIGVIDKNNKKHPVFFKEGLNIVTGDSATGKTALLEIFNYCMGSSNQIPKGIITNCASIYYICLFIANKTIVLGRIMANNKCFKKPIVNYNKDLISYNFFDKAHFISENNFRNALRDEFLDIDNVNTDKEQDTKSPRPTVRSWSSFMLQDQSLIASRHALFCRFDEKEKREEVLRNIQFFLKFVDQNYFNLKQQQSDLENKQRYLERAIENEKNLVIKLTAEVQTYLDNLATTLEKITLGIPAEQFIKEPRVSMQAIEKLITDHSEQLKSTYVEEHKRDELLTQIKEEQKKLRVVIREINTIETIKVEHENFTKNINTKLYEKIEFDTTKCPLCLNKTDALNNAYSKLKDSQAVLSNINIANKHAHLESKKLKLEQEKTELEQKIKLLEKQLDSVRRIGEIKEQYEARVLCKLQLQQFVNTHLDSEISNSQKRLNDVNKELSKINIKLSEEYDIQNKIARTNKEINKYMNEIGKKFDFETEYKDNLNLVFSIENFELYQQVKNDKIYLSSIGSGANWLYCHISLFLALHKYFLINDSLIPSILFLDQPSQVYSPSPSTNNNEGYTQLPNNNNTSFTLQYMVAGARVGATTGIGRNKNDINFKDEDTKALENLFTQLARYYKKLDEEYGFSPQIIITEHADNLKLDGFEFNDFVGENRWKNGKKFINI